MTFRRSIVILGALLGLTNPSVIFAAPGDAFEVKTARGRILVSDPIFVEREGRIMLIAQIDNFTDYRWPVISFIGTIRCGEELREEEFTARFANLQTGRSKQEIPLPTLSAKTNGCSIASVQRAALDGQATAYQERLNETAERARRRRAECADLYRATANKRISDLTVREDHAIKSCDADGLFEPSTDGQPLK